MCMRVRVCAVLTQAMSRLINSPVEACFEPRTDADYRVNGKVWNAEATFWVTLQECDEPAKLLWLCEHSGCTHTHTHSQQGTCIPYSDNVWVTEALGRRLRADLYQTGNICLEYKRIEGLHLLVATKGWSQALPQLMGDTWSCTYSPSGNRWIQTARQHLHRMFITPKSSITHTQCVHACVMSCPLSNANVLKKK